MGILIPSLLLSIEQQYKVTNVILPSLYTSIILQDVIGPLLQSYLCWLQSIISNMRFFFVSVWSRKIARVFLLDI